MKTHLVITNSHPLEYSHQPLLDIAAICAAHGIEQAVLSPGSRCAPLTIGFARHPDIRCITIPDERSAAFVAMGMAQAAGKPVVLVCTSGTAAQQYGAAIAEAFFQQIPLLVLTADRPPEWYDQWDGQTIRQRHLHQNHIKAQFDLPASYAHPDELWCIYRSVNEAINEAVRYPCGPVHVNIPIREPFYPAENQELGYTQGLKIIRESKPVLSFATQDIEELSVLLAKVKRVVVVAGQMERDLGLASSLEDWKVPVLADIISNMQRISQALSMQDWFLVHHALLASMKPDLLITFGKSVISKHTKLFLRAHRPKHHWHISPSGYVPDTFQSLTKVIRCEPKHFFSSLNRFFVADPSYLSAWQEMENTAIKALGQAIDHAEPAGGEGLLEFKAVKAVLDELPEGTHLHLANSMSVRYANYLGKPKQSLILWSNRGTSGIDGCTSTAIGHAIAQPEALHVLLTGDLAFFYDRNAFWHQHLPKNFKVILLNNQGGIIFNMIKGPASLPENRDYFVTQQPLHAQHLASESGIPIWQVTTRQGLMSAIARWLKAEGGILEIRTDIATSTQHFKSVAQQIRTALASLIQDQGW